MIFLLLVVFQVKHFLADYPLQGKYMLGKFKSGNEWIAPLAAHAGVHLLFTSGIVYVYTRELNLALMLGLLDFVLHFSMDRIKASPNMLGRFKNFSSNEYYFIDQGKFPKMTYIYNANTKEHYVENKFIHLSLYDIRDKFKSNTLFWYSLGLDQMVHHLTHYLIIYLMVTR